MPALPATLNNQQVMLKRPLTDRQEQVLNFVTEYVDKNRDFPSFRTIQEALGYSSPNSITQNMHALVRKGYLMRDPSGQYDFAKEYAYLSPRSQRELREFFRGLLEMWMRGAQLTPELKEQYTLTFEEILSGEER